MSKGKFEAGRSSASAKRRGKGMNLALPIGIGAAALAVLGIGIWLLVKGSSVPETIPANVSICNVELGGMTEEEAVKALTAALPERFSQDMSVDMGEDEAPVILHAEQINASIDPAAAAAAARRATFAPDGSVILDTESFVRTDNAYLKTTAEQAVTDYSRELQQPSVEEVSEMREVEVKLEDGKTEKQQKEFKNLVITTGVDQHSFTEKDFCTCVRDAYVRLDFAPKLSYTDGEVADPVDVDALSEKYCIEPIDAVFDPETFEVTPDVPGYGFDAEELKLQLADAKPGEEILVVLTELEAEATAEKLKSSLFADVLGECDTPHTWINDRTHNLELACAAIDGTILMPGEVFSFNNVVGERTKAKGYREAIVYVSGQSVPETGGGVCQVASTIYSACLYADLEIVESYAHQFFVTYVNPGMDATIYWKSLDYKFRNNTAYPMRIDASVHDGRVWVKLMGTNTKDYTVKMSWEMISKTNWETVEQEIKPGDPYKPGEEITSPYTGYKYVTYMSKYDMDGNLISKTQVRVSNYSKRDKVIAVAPEEDPTEPTEQPTEPTAPPTEPTTPPTEPTTPPTDPTEPSPPDVTLPPDHFD